MDVPNASQLHLTPGGQLWASQAHDDPIPPLAQGAGASHGPLPTSYGFGTGSVPAASTPDRAAASYWHTHGFRVIDDGRPRRLDMNVENTTDGFLMQMLIAPNGAISLGATSPCIWPQGAPAPPTTGG